MDYFEKYPAIRARHSYGPQGHRGMSVLIFESSATGYFEAERLHKELAEQGLDRNAWGRRRGMVSGGVRQLYGFLATKQDLDVFNQHCQGSLSDIRYIILRLVIGIQISVFWFLSIYVFMFDFLGKTRLKFEMKSYQEMVVKELRQISEDNQQLNWFKNKLTKQNKLAKVLEESLEIATEKLRKTAEDNRIVRQRTKMQHEENREEVCRFLENHKL